jgi:Coenzyme PQQ synthesis protein D (PqqD)
MSQHHQAQWHNVVPKHAIEWEDGPEGGAVLLVPRFRWGPMKRWLQPRLKRPNMRVKLDEIGSYAWKQMDGINSYEAIVDAMKGEFGEKIEPAEDRLGKFLTVLYRDKFVELYKPSDDTVEGA